MTKMPIQIHLSCLCLVGMLSLLGVQQVQILSSLFSTSRKGTQHFTAVISTESSVRSFQHLTERAFYFSLAIHLGFSTNEN